MPAKVSQPLLIDEANQKRWQWLIYLGWLTSVVATLGSLFFSEVMNLPPCVLCWYQRICMYPLTVLFTVALVGNDRNVRHYAWPLAVVGFGTSVYHNLLYYKILSESFSPCRQGISCTTRQITWYGFVTIPLLALVAFTVVLAVLIRLSTFAKPSPAKELAHEV